ncbi:MAG TPA: hypothetical protein VM715_01650 [Candidatus Acidoferrum sp.]|jgi:hypothetical protein|nr:hypothetical protein [Candidatus Acidoferrum sp.]
MSVPAALPEVQAVLRRGDGELIFAVKREDLSPAGKCILMIGAVHDFQVVGNHWEKLFREMQPLEFFDPKQIWNTLAFPALAHA